MGYDNYLREKIEKTSLDMEPSEWKTLQLKTSIPLSVAATISIYFLTESVTITAAGFLLSTIVVFGSTIFALDYLTYVKAKEVEEELPEALELLASNLKAGLSIKDSLQVLMSEEFGQLGVEMETAITDMNTGTPMDEALRRTTTHVDSALYAKTIETLSRSIESGVNMATVSGQLARNINDMQNIHKKIRASSVTYTMFLSFAAFIAAPILFALSTFLVQASTQIFEVAAAQGEGGISGLGGLSFSTQLPPVDLLINFFLVAIAVTSFFTSLGVGIVREGSMKVGLKYVPIFMTLAFIVYFVARGLITSFIGISI